MKTNLNLRTVALIATLFISTSIFAEDFFIVKVMGAIKVNGQAAKPGDKISTGDKISFASAQSKAIVISPKRGQLILQKDKVAAQNELELKLASLVQPKSNYLATRGLVTNENELVQYFNNPHVIIDSLKLTLLGDQFKMDEKEFYFIRFNYNGESISKKIDFVKKDGIQLQLSKGSLLTVDGSKIDTADIKDLEFVHFNTTTKKLRVINNQVHFVFVDETELKKDLELILPHIAPKDQIGEVKTYIDIVYGAVEKEQVKAFLASMK